MIIMAVTPGVPPNSNSPEVSTLCSLAKELLLGRPRGRPLGDGVAAPLGLGLDRSWDDDGEVSLVSLGVAAAVDLRARAERRVGVSTKPG